MAEEENTTYADRQRRQFAQIIDGLELADLQKRFLRDRWLDQLLWYESKAAYNQRRYYALRLVVIIGGVTVPALVSLGIRGSDVDLSLTWVAFILSLVVAIAASLDAFFSYGQRWRSFRRTAEALKAHGWQYFELAGPYASADHASVFPAFAAQVETLFQQEVEGYIAQAARSKTPEQGRFRAPE